MKKLIYTVLAIVSSLMTTMAFTACSSDKNKPGLGQGDADDSVYLLDSVVVVSPTGTIETKQIYRYDQQGTWTELETIDNTQNTHTLCINESVDSIGRVLHQIVYDVSDGKHDKIQEATDEYKDNVLYEAIDKVDGICTKAEITYDKDERVKEKDITSLADNGLYQPYYTVVYEYDDHGNVVSEKYSDKSNIDYHVNYSYEYEYDDKCQKDQYVSKTKYYLPGGGSKLVDSRSELKYDSLGNVVMRYEYQASEYGKPVTLSSYTEYTISADIPSDKVKNMTHIPWQPHASTVTKGYDASGKLISTSTYYISKKK